MSTPKLRVDFVLFSENRMTRNNAALVEKTVSEAVLKPPAPMSLFRYSPD